MKNTIRIALVLSLAFAGLSVPATQYSKLSIVTYLKVSGKIAPFKAWLKEKDLEDEWANCQYVADTYPYFSLITNSIVETGMISADELSGLLNSSVDTAVPDSFVSNLYSRDMSNETGRVHWHGKMTYTTVDTNDCTMTQHYEDGWTFTIPFTPVRPKPIDDQMSEAERRRRAEEAQRKTYEKYKADETNEIARLQKRYPPALAGLLYTNRLHTLALPKNVNVDVKPEGK